MPCVEAYKACEVLFVSVDVVIKHVLVLIMAW